MVEVVALRKFLRFAPNFADDIPMASNPRTPTVLPVYDTVPVQHAFHGGRTLLAAILGLGLIQGRIADAGFWGIVVLAAAGLSIALAVGHVWGRSSGATRSIPESIFVALDIVLAFGLITLVSDGAAPIAWVALVVPVAEAALAYNMATAVGVWAVIGLSHLAWTIQQADSATAGQDSLTSSLQQLLAILLLAIPASLLAKSFRSQVRQLTSANALAKRDADALRLVGERVGRMNEMSSPTEVLVSCAEGAVELGFVAAEIVVDDGDQWHLLASRHPEGYSIVSPEVLAIDIPAGSDFADLLPDTETSRQDLHLYGAGFGRAIRLDTDRENGQPVLRVWSAPNSTPSDHNMETLALLATQTAKVHDTVQGSARVALRTKELAYQAAHDPLTSLVNHRTILGTLNARVADEHDLSVLFIDLDGFKPVNDNHGHEAGDQALVIVADRLKQVAGEQAVVGRMGGDEFVVMGSTKRMATSSHPFGLGLAVLEAIRQPMSINDNAVQLGASIGAASWSQGLSGAELLKRADRAMYEAKQSGTGLSVWTAQPHAELAPSEPVQ